MEPTRGLDGAPKTGHPTNGLLYIFVEMPVPRHAGTARTICCASLGYEPYHIYPDFLQTCPPGPYVDPGTSDIP